MIFRLVTAVAFATALSITTSQAKRITGAYVECVSKQALDEFISAASNKDYRNMEALLNVPCFSIEGLEYSNIDPGFITSRIRVYVGNSSVILWVPAEGGR